jgi:hypothetical protein
MEGVSRTICLGWAQVMILLISASQVAMSEFVSLFSDCTEVWTHGFMLAKQVFLCLSHSTSPQVARITCIRQVCTAKVIVHLVLHISTTYQCLLHSVDKCSWMNEILFAFKCYSCISPSVFLSPLSRPSFFLFFSGHYVSGMPASPIDLAEICSLPYLILSYFIMFWNQNISLSATVMIEP